MKLKKYFFLLHWQSFIYFDLQYVERKSEEIASPEGHLAIGIRAGPHQIRRILSAG